jgi:beta-glucosidase
MSSGLKASACTAALLLALPGLASAAPKASATRPWMNTKLSPDRRADLLIAKMTLDEEIALLHGDFPGFMPKRPPGVQISAGYVRGEQHLGIPDLTESDASLGVANARRSNDDATPLPSGYRWLRPGTPRPPTRGVR